jgi:hypothetical protein
MPTLDGSIDLLGSLSRTFHTMVVALRSRRQYGAVSTVHAARGRGERGEERDVASKDKGGGKTSKKPAQHDLKAKRKAKKEKRASK